VGRRGERDNVNETGLTDIELWACVWVN